MAGAATRSAFENLARGFENNHEFGHMHPYDLYRAWLEAVWAFLDMPSNPDGFRQCLDHYTREQGAEFARLLNLYVQALEDHPFRDILGEIFMRLDLKSVQAGQYFSPGSIADLMARIQFNRADFERIVSEKGFVTVCDPAVGSGVMLLAYAKIVNAELGRQGLGRLRLYGQDIDQRCVLMCRIQLRMNGLDAMGRLAGLLAGQAPDAVAGNNQLLLPGVAA